MLYVQTNTGLREASASEILDAAATLKLPTLEKYDQQNPASVQKYLAEVLGSRPAECFAAVWLDGEARIIAFDILFHGTVDKTAIHAREVIRAAIKHNAVYVVFSHNHPHGKCSPSGPDYETTDLLTAALNTIDVKVLDHVIVKGTETYSMGEHEEIGPEAMMRRMKKKLEEEDKAREKFKKEAGEALKQLFEEIGEETKKGKTKITVQ